MIISWLMNTVLCRQCWHPSLHEMMCSCFQMQLSGWISLQFMLLLKFPAWKHATCMLFLPISYPKRVREYWSWIHPYVAQCISVASKSFFKVKCSLHGNLKVDLSRSAGNNLWIVLVGDVKFNTLMSEKKCYMENCCQIWTWKLDCVLLSHSKVYWGESVHVPNWGHCSIGPICMEFRIFQK